MSSVRWGFLLTIDGCPFIFGTQDVTEVPDPVTPESGADFAYDLSLDASYIQGALVSPMGDPANGISALSWSETIIPFEGDVEVDGLSFYLHDVLYNDERLITKLATREPVDMTQCLLSATIDDTDTSFTVDNGSAFPSGDQVVYIEREAIRCSGRSGNTFTVAASGRGYYGSRAVSHIADSGNIYYPKVFADFPSFSHRRVVLWCIDHTGDGLARPLWRGYISRSPRLAEKGTMYELQCEHFWTREKNENFGQTPGLAQLRGFNAYGVGVTIYLDTNSPLKSSPPAGVEYPVYGDYSTCLNDGVQAPLMESIRAGTLAASLRVALSSLDGGTKLVVRSEVDPGGCLLGVGSRSAYSPSFPYPLSTNYYMSVTVPGTPQCLVVLRMGRDDELLPLTTTRGFTATLGETSYVDSTFTTATQRTLIWDVGDDTQAVFYASSLAENSTDCPSGGPAAIGRAEFVSRQTGRTTFQESGFAGSSAAYTGIGSSIGGGGDNILLFTQTLTVREGVSIRSEHVIYAFKRGFFNAFSFVPLIDTRNWDWTHRNVDYCAHVSAGPGLGRSWLLDGSQRTGELLCDNLKIHGLALTVRDSRILPVAMVVPNESTTTVATLTTADYVGKPEYTELADHLVNTVSIETAGGKILVRDQESIALYGQTRTVTANVAGIDDAALSTATPLEVGLSALGRLTGLWRHPPKQVTVTVSLQRFYATIYAGDFVKVSDWLAPSGTGTRGLSEALGQVKSRSIDLGEGTLKLEVILYRAKRVVGYAPAARVASRSGATLTIATSYLGSVSTAGGASEYTTATDYAGSNLSWYQGTANDGGTGWFAAGDKVRLITRGSTTLTTEGGLEVQSVNAATKQVVLTTTPSTTISSANDLIDLVYDDYSTSSPTAGQKVFGWIADGTPPVIDGTADKAKVWAP